MGIKQRSKSLTSKNHPLADMAYQLEVLDPRMHQGLDIRPFHEQVSRHLPEGLVARSPHVLQVNVGKLCNQSCAHCHVDAGPDRREMMDRAVMERCLEIMAQWKIPTLDITGGAPEMSPGFRWLVEQATSLGIQVMNRCNLTIIVAHDKYRDLPEFFAKHGVHIISSLPHYSKMHTDRQRGDGVYEDSISALKMLNEVGYGQGDPQRKLDLVYNPAGAFLPGDQASLEASFKSQLQRRHGITFDDLFCITNLPVSRYLDYLIESGNYERYMTELSNAFNPHTLDGLMCRDTLSIDYRGYVYDCDFNQMLDLKSDVPHPHVDHIALDDLIGRSIKTKSHCYGCTAGAGSSCGGTIA